MARTVHVVLGAQMLPLVSFLLIGGVWADRLPRARLMLGTDIARAVLRSLLALLIFTDAVEIWHLVVIEALFGIAMALSIPPYNGLVPRTVPADEVQDAQALSGFTFNLAELTGPAIARCARAPGCGWRPERPMLAAFLVIAVWPVGLVSFALGAPVAVVLPLTFAAGPVADATSTETVLVGGAILTATVLALGLLPRETRTLRRVQHRSRV